MADTDNRAKAPSEIRREIEQTRASMGRTVDALEVKLDPQRLKAQATSALREKTVGRVENFADDASETVKGAGYDVFDAIKKNPLPAAIAAIGLGWLFMESRNEGRERSYRLADRNRNASPYGYRYGSESAQYGQDRDWQSGGRQPMDRMRETGSNIQDRAGYMASSVGDKASNMASNVRDTAGEFAGNVGEAASNVGEKASDIAMNVRDTAGDMAMSVRDTAGDVAMNVRDTAGQVADKAQHEVYKARTRLETMMEENPLLIGAAAMALGAAIGMSLPSTQKEDELLGNVRDNFMEKAQDSAKETMDKVQNVAKEATQAAQETVKSEAQKQNLIS